MTFFLTFSVNASSVDRGKITDIYTNNAGHVGIRLIAVLLTPNKMQNVRVTMAGLVCINHIRIY
jgi:hypothetical protein